MQLIFAFIAEINASFELNKRKLAFIQPLCETHKKNNKPEQTLMQDIYGLDATSIIIRISTDDVNAFNQHNEFSIDQIKRELEDKEIECFFQRVAPEEHKVIVPILGGQLEIYTKLHSSETYQAVVSKKLKTAFRNEIKLPEKDYHKETVSIRIIDVNDRGRATDEFDALFKKVENLSIATTINVENQQEIWFKWIEAQKAIIDSLQKPYQVKSAPFLQETKNNDGEVTRYTLKFDLANEILPEYKQLEAKLKELGIEEKFDGEGNVFLTREQITLLDTVIQREFPDKLERSQTISVILKLRPLTLAQKIQKEIGVTVSQNHHNKQLFIDCKANEVLNQTLRNKGFEFKQFRGEFKIINHGNIIENDSLNNKHSITFGQRFVKPENEKELLLPYPENNTFIYYNADYFTLQLSYQHLIGIYGKENIETILQSIYEAINPKEVHFFDKDFTEDFWVELKRKLYVHNLDDAINSFSQSLYLEYNSEEELQTQLNLIEDLQVCDIAYSPNQPDFRFKIKTNVIAKKSEKELFLEKIKLLRGAEFVVEVAKEGSKRNELIYIGKLNGNESDIQKLVLNIPNIFPDDKKKAKEVLKFLNAEKKPIIKEIRANLTGDATKIGWLQTAIQKITQPTDAPNGKAANEQLGEFIFDTSKATPIYDETKVTENSEYYWDVRNNELLKLNEAQRKAVLAAIHCTDLALLQGPPGTGKTTVIAEIIWQIISKDPKHRILLTSETNLAVDNALDRLLNTKGVNPNLAKYTTLIKPLRFGRMGKMDEEGAKYSVDRIMKWLDETYQIPQEYEPDTLDEKDEELDDDVQKNSPENNAVQDWMKRIASRAKNNNPKYGEALKHWANELTNQPTKEVKQIFKDKYFEYANIVGSTCSSSGSPRFMWDSAKVFSSEELDLLKSLQYLATVAPASNKFLEQIEEAEVPSDLYDDFKEKLDSYQDDYESLKEDLKDERGRFDRDELKQEAELLDSYIELKEFSKLYFPPYFEPKVQFDTVIMDEASKATPPELVLPLCFAKRSIVIGDHRQLPPMLNEKDFREALQEAGAGHLADEIDREFTETSQFERMILNPKVSPTIISRCNIQYRMHPDINKVIKQFYLDEGGLEPAQELIENADDHNLNNIFSRHHGLFFQDFIDANTHTIWINIKTPEMREGTSVTNEGEVKAIHMVIEMLKKAEGFEAFQKHWDFIKDDFKRKQEKEIGIISFYGAQKRLIKRSLVGIGVPLKINTVDRFQGMERNIIIVSTVRSNNQIMPLYDFNRFKNKQNLTLLKTLGNGRVLSTNNDSGFAKSPQRLNVALSRGKRLLIVVGNKDFFEQVTDKTSRTLYKNAIAEMTKVIDFETLQNKFKK
jgi:superfamily I DNA and/or RNA helicase